MAKHALRLVQKPQDTPRQFLLRRLHLTLLFTQRGHAGVMNLSQNSLNN